jgi:4-hydroxymandelate oxidase
VFGTSWDNPIILAPVGAQKMFHPDGELAVARAARSKGHLQILSTSTTTPVEDVIATRGAPVWFQLYPTDVWDVTLALIRRAEAAGCPVLALTVDNQGGTNPETIQRFARKDSRRCNMCHESVFSGFVRRRRMFDGIDVSKVTTMLPYGLNWDFVQRLRNATKMKFIIKGIVTREDARLAVEYGVDGVIVSNHGGRSEDSGRSTIQSLPEVVEGVGGKIPVLVDGGFRRGADVFKALALGAKAIAIGRPYLFGLAAFGQPGVETVLTILRLELLTIMRQAGTTSMDKITPAYLVAAPR